MKGALAFFVIIGILLASGSVAYYYLYFLPQQNIKTQQDISAIRSVVAPTKAQVQEVEQAYNAYFKCESDMQQKRMDYIDKQCPQSTVNYDYMKSFKCRSDASSEAMKIYSCSQP